MCYLMRERGNNEHIHQTSNSRTSVDLHRDPSASSSKGRFFVSNQLSALLHAPGTCSKQERQPIEDPRSITITYTEKRLHEPWSFPYENGHRWRKVQTKSTESLAAPQSFCGSLTSVLACAEDLLKPLSHGHSAACPCLIRIRYPRGSKQPR